jgi:hypothetical protein
VVGDINDSESLVAEIRDIAVDLDRECVVQSQVPACDLGEAPGR